MSGRKKMLCLWVLILLAGKLFGQYDVAGQVIDGETNSPLAFVNILFNHNVLTSPMNDINGRCRYLSPEAITRLIFIYIRNE